MRRSVLSAVTAVSTLCGSPSPVAQGTGGELTDLEAYAVYAAVLPWLVKNWDLRRAPFLLVVQETTVDGLREREAR